MVEHTYPYETMFIVNADKTEEEINAIVEKFKGLIEKNGQLEAMDVWGKRRLAYEIDDKTEGYYVLIHFTSAPEFPRELERNFGITEGVMRYMVIRKDEKKLQAAAAKEAAPAEQAATPAE